ncbi:putative malate dehydrogenase 1B isoform X2 [Triplophysa rosa]|uniref:Malate dehydrogenase 1B n=1 Tax=Triplophysa rosa TaxID=992332 RepID=A0A9W8C8K7_TRIRA|nr:putative malate dehydrogenase 1B isoform X2 [Triplophysa rosa]KAI7810955.1 putative malate dehydrogenase 1B [Triplophysa rosa]
MAKFVLAGKADCPYYAKAELLADVLRQKLPDFHIHKICVHPTDWKVWLEDTCALHGWKHSSSPIVWRELVDRGGKGMLLGGFSDFLEHARGYYGITSDMTTDLMLKIAAENLQTKELCMREEFQRCNSLTPLHVWISSALNPVCYNLIPQLFTPGPFPNSPAINLHLLDTDGSVEQLRELKIETEDLALPHLHEVTIHSDQTQAFHQAHFIIVLDDPLSKRDRNDEQDDKEHAVSRVAERFRCYGQLIEANAQKDVRVLVAGDVFINLKCSLLIENVPSVDPCNFVSMATQLECEAKAQLAQKLAVKTTDITNIIIWGNITGNYHIDLQKAAVFRYNGAVWGPDRFSQPVLDMIYDRKWLETDSVRLVRERRATISSKTNKATGVSTTNGILAVLRAWNNDTSADEFFSLGVYSTGQFGIPEGLVFSMPVSFRAGQWSPRLDVSVTDELKTKLEACTDELKTERHIAAGILKERVSEDSLHQ